jgi:hypothetical protein
VGVSNSTSQIVVARACILVAYSCHETSGTAAAAAKLLNGSGTSGELGFHVGAGSGGTNGLSFGEHGVVFDAGMFLVGITGTMDLVLVVRSADPPDPPA